MKAIEFDATISPDGKIDVAKPLRDALPQKPVRVILLWKEQDEEEAAWQEAALSIFREGDGPYDVLYDHGCRTATPKDNQEVSEISFVIPSEVVQTTRMTEGELAREMGVLLFQMEKLTLGQASRLAGMSQLQFQHLLASRQIPVHYDVAEFEEDVKTLRELGRL
jgi:predicted HTH domain antitoxin